MRTISSQMYLDGEIVAAKRRLGDYAAQRAVIEIDGECLYVVVDGHHSAAAAKLDGQPIAWERAHHEVQASADRAGSQGPEAVAEWMAQHQGDAEWYDFATGRLAW